MTRRRALALALTTAGAMAVAAPAAGAAVSPASVTFGANSVDVQDLGATANTVRFTMHVTNPDTTRLFIDIRGHGHSRIALGNTAALGVPHAVYNDVSTD